MNVTLEWSSLLLTKNWADLRILKIVHLNLITFSRGLAAPDPHDILATNFLLLLASLIVETKVKLVSLMADISHKVLQGGVRALPFTDRTLVSIRTRAAIEGWYT